MSVDGGTRQCEHYVGSRDGGSDADENETRGAVAHFEFHSDNEMEQTMYMHGDGDVHDKNLIGVDKFAMETEHPTELAMDEHVAPVAGKFIVFLDGEPIHRIDGANRSVPVWDRIMLIKNWVGLSPGLKTICVFCIPYRTTCVLNLVCMSPYRTT